MAKVRIRVLRVIARPFRWMGAARASYGPHAAPQLRGNREQGTGNSGHDAEALWPNVESGPGANKFAAGKSRNPPSRIVADGADRSLAPQHPAGLRCGRAGAWAAAHRPAAE